jgi:hypothetical protein
MSSPHLVLPVLRFVDFVKNMKIHAWAIWISATAFSASARDYVPEYRIENVPSIDGSVQQSLVFRTVAGVNYRVETSENLSNWSQVDEIYGMGHEYVVPIRQFIAPPPLPPGTTPIVLPPRPEAAPTLMMRRSNGPEGGTVVGWKSLDDGGPMEILIEGGLHEDWATVPLFSHRYGGTTSLSGISPCRPLRRWRFPFLARGTLR